MKRRTASRSHVIVRFAEAPRREQVQELERRGAKILQYVPDFGVMLSTYDNLDLEGLGLVWAGRLQEEDKISPLLGDEDTEAGGSFVVEFHPDVWQQDTLSLAQEHGLEVLDHPDLVPNQILVRGRLEKLRQLAEWDEVSYVFPASEDLAQGRRVRACSGAVTALGTVGQYVAKVGDGWDGPGRNSAALGYFFERLSRRLPEDRTREEVLRAVREWAQYVSVTFFPATGSTSPRTLNILFAPRNHGDFFPFDGPSGVLAHTYYPAPPNPEPIAGDIHFDDDEEWVIGPDLTMYSVDLFSVALHEVGHAMGLGHSDQPGTVMYPYYRRLSGLATEDITGIQELYATPASPPDGRPPETAPLSLQIQSPPAFPLTTTADRLSISGSVTGGSGDVQVTWVSDRGASGIAQGGRSWSILVLPLQAGDNTVTITAADTAQSWTSQTAVITRHVEQTPPDVRITAPTTGGTYSSSSASIVVAGTASHPSGISLVAWSNSQGGGGAAAGTETWSTGPIALRPGRNEITITAHASDGGSASRTLAVTYTADTKDTVAPYLKIVSPSSTSVLTYSSTISIRGTALDNVGVVQVTWSTSTGKSGTAAGTSSWNTEEIPLLVGTNTIVVRALDAAGNAGWRSVTVTRT